MDRPAGMLRIPGAPRPLRPFRPFRSSPFLSTFVRPGRAARLPWPAFPVLLMAAASAVPAPCGAQVHHLQEIPWHVLDGEGPRFGAEMAWLQQRESRTRWHADRLGLTVLAPAGGRGAFFLRLEYVRFDSGGRSAPDRWPQTAPGVFEESGTADPAWPYESIINDFARPELGFVFPARLPLAGAGRMGVRAGLPIGTDRLYPMSAGCLPLSIDWRAVRHLSGAWKAAVRAGFEHTFASSGDELDGSAFPGGWRYAWEAGYRDGRGLGADLVWSARELDGGRNVRRLTLQGWVPLGQGNFCRLLLARDLGRVSDRLATWSLGVTWHFSILSLDDQQ